MTAQRAMNWWCWAMILFGALLVGAGFAATDGPVVFLLEAFRGGPVEMSEPMRFSTGLTGALTIGWGASLLAVLPPSATLAPDQRITLWRRIGWALLAWYLIDSAISVATGFWPNVVSNTVLAGAYWAIARRM